MHFYIYSVCDFSFSFYASLTYNCTKWIDHIKISFLSIENHVSLIIIWLPFSHHTLPQNRPLKFLWRLLVDCHEYFSPTNNHKWNQRLLSSSLKIVLPAHFLLSLTTFRIFEKMRLNALFICLCPHSEETIDLNYDF